MNYLIIYSPFLEYNKKIYKSKKYLPGMDTSIFEELGLTPAEIKIYLALLEQGVSTAGPILQKTGLQNSVVHLTLAKLLVKGFISFVKKGKVKQYRAADPKKILTLI